jgi:hypothetical protein
MARAPKYDWPDDEKLQALLDEHGTAETARRLGCPPSSLSNRIRQRGLRGTKRRRKPDAEKANGKPEAERPDAEKANGKPELPNQIQQSLAELGEVLSRIPEESGGAASERSPFIPPTAVKRGRESSSAGESGSAEPTQSSPRKRRRRRWVRSRLRRVPPSIWRGLAVLGLAALAGLTAFMAVRNDPKTYERELSFAIRPSETVPPDALSDVTGTLAQPDSAVTVSIVDILGSSRLRSSAAQQAGLSPGSVAESGAPYQWNASRRPGSTIIDLRLTGPDDAKLVAMQTGAAAEAASLVESNYTLFRLEPLSAPTPRRQVGPQIDRTVGLAVLLGGFLGITLVLLDRRLRGSSSGRPRDRGGEGRPIGNQRSQWGDGPPPGPTQRIGSGER